jgi:ELWxxDGT repeat protein
MRIPYLLLLSCLTLVPSSALAQIELVKSFEYTDFGLLPGDLVAIGDQIFFHSWTAEHGMELWKSDGTEAGTVLVKDINPGAAHSMAVYESRLTAVGDILFFAANDGVHGRELWRSDGTEQGTYMVKDIRPGSASSDLAYFSVAQDRLFFRANADYPAIPKLYASDGTEAGTLPRHAFGGQDLIFAGTGGYPIMLGDRVYFKGSTTGSGSGGKIWYTEIDSTFAVMHVDISEVPGSSVVGVGRMVPGNTRFYFPGNNGLNGLELYWSNGSDTTRMVLDIAPGTASANIVNMDVKDDILYFYPAEAPLEQRGLWRSDGTTDGTYLVRPMLMPWGSAETMIRQMDDQVLFVGWEEATGNELWRSDGTEAGTTLVKDIRPGTVGSLSSGGSLLRVFDNILYFTADVPQFGNELWRSDGTEQGTYIIQDRRPGSDSFGPGDLVRMGDNLYMTGSIGNFDRGIYRMQLPTTSVAEGPDRREISLWPNPASGTFHVRLPQGTVTSQVHVSLSDATGRSVALPSSAINVQGDLLNITTEGTVVPGMYLVTVRTTDLAPWSARVVLENAR